MTALPRQRHRRHANPFTIRGPLVAPNWQVIYGRAAPLALDIGCGSGRFVCDLAAAHPQWNVLGVEIRQHLVDATRTAAAAGGLAHVHALLANANEQLPSLLEPQSVAFVAVNFPDPWYKKRHHKRRVLRPQLLTALTPKLIDGAHIHAMSDFAPIAAEMREALTSQPGFTSMTPGEEFAADSTTGFTSEREIKHLQRGEKIYRLHFVYTLAKTCPDPVKAGDLPSGW